MQIWCDGVKRCHPELVSGFSGYFIDTLSFERITITQYSLCVRLGIVK